MSRVWQKSLMFLYLISWPGRIKRCQRQAVWRCSEVVIRAGCCWRDVNVYIGKKMCMNSTLLVACDEDAVKWQFERACLLAAELQAQVYQQGAKDRVWWCCAAERRCLCWNLCRYLCLYLPLAEAALHTVSALFSCRCVLLISSWMCSRYLVVLVPLPVQTGAEPCPGVPGQDVPALLQHHPSEGQTPRSPRQPGNNTSENINKVS